MRVKLRLWAKPTAHKKHKATIATHHITSIYYPWPPVAHLFQHHDERLLLIGSPAAKLDTKPIRLYIQPLMMSTRAISCSILLIVRSTIVTCLITKLRCSPRVLLVMRSSSVSHQADLLEMQKSRDSSFWRVMPQPKSPLSSLPALHGIDRETGRLPPGAYQTNGSDDDSESHMCLIGVKIRPPTNSKQGDDIWTAGVKNCRKMIDSGFNTFNVGNTHETTTSNNKTQDDRNGLTKQSIAAAKKLQDLYTAEIRQRHDSETQFYKYLRHVRTICSQCAARGTCAPDLLGCGAASRSFNLHTSKLTRIKPPAIMYLLVPLIGQEHEPLLACSLIERWIGIPCP